MQQEALTEYVQRIRAEIRQQLLDMRVSLTQNAQELRTTLIEQEAQRKHVAEQEARERSAQIQNIRDEVRAQLSVDMEILRAQVEETRQERQKLLRGKVKSRLAIEKKSTPKRKRTASRKKKTRDSTSKDEA